jgi:hypothetical protein
MHGLAAPFRQTLETRVPGSLAGGVPGRCIDRRHPFHPFTPESFSLDGDQPVITVEAAYSKRKRKDFQLIRADVAEELRGFLNGKP